MGKKTKKQHELPPTHIKSAHKYTQPFVPSLPSATVHERRTQFCVLRQGPPDCLVNEQIATFAVFPANKSKNVLHSRAESLILNPPPPTQTNMNESPPLSPYRRHVFHKMAALLSSFLFRDKSTNNGKAIKHDIRIAFVPTSSRESRLGARVGDTTKSTKKKRQ